MRKTSKCRAWPCPACCTLEIHILGPQSHVSHIDEGEHKLHERCLVSGVPPCYRLVGEPSHKAAGRPCTMARCESCTVPFRLQLYV